MAKRPAIEPPKVSKVRRIDGIRVVGMPGIVCLRTSSVDDGGYRAEAGITELSLVAALTLAQQLLDAAVDADGQEKSLPPDVPRTEWRTA